MLGALGMFRRKYDFVIQLTGLCDMISSEVSSFVVMIFFLLGSDTGIIRGFVSDATNGEKLCYANVYLKEKEVGAATNDKGYYVINKVPSGSHTIIASYVGYQDFTENIEISPGEVITLNIELRPSPIMLKGITVSGQRLRFEEVVEPSRITISQNEIRSVPKFFEADLVRTIQLLPGVVTMHDLSNKLYIRGGSPDENLALLDGITIYNPSTHLFGLFSTFNPDAVKSVDLFLGGFPAKYGDRLSAVMDVTTKEGNSKKLSGKASLGLISSKLLLEGPIPKGSFLISGRRSYFDLVAKGFKRILNEDISLPYYFYDGVAKINYNLSTENRFTWAAMVGADVINLTSQEIEDFDGKISLKWGNKGTSLRWKTLLHSKIYGEFVGAVSDFFTRFSYQEDEDEGSVDQEILDYCFRSDFNYFHSDFHKADLGFELRRLRFTGSWRHKSKDTIIEESEPTKIPYLFTSYLQDRWKLTPLFYIQPGVRFIYYSMGNKYRLDPRLGFKYRFSENTTINIGLGKYSQFLATLNSQESYFSIFDFWVPVEEFQDLPTAYHIITGVEQWLGENERFTIETYYKKYDDLLIPKDNPLFFSFPSESLRVGTGYATGLDIYLKKHLGTFYGWISYSLGLTKRKVGTKSYSPRYDRRHNLNIVVGTRLSRKFPLISNAKFDVHWYFASGLPYAGDLARYRKYTYDFIIDDAGEMWWEYITGSRDAYRYPSAHRLDFHLEKDMRLFGLSGSWYIDVLNVYGYRTVVFYDWEYDDPDTGEELERPQKEPMYFLPKYPIPSVGINLKF